MKIQPELLACLKQVPIGRNETTWDLIPTWLKELIEKDYTPKEIGQAYDRAHQIRPWSDVTTVQGHPAWRREASAMWAGILAVDEQSQSMIRAVELACKGIHWTQCQEALSATGLRDTSPNNPSTL